MMFRRIGPESEGGAGEDPSKGQKNFADHNCSPWVEKNGMVLWAFPRGKEYIRRKY